MHVRVTACQLAELGDSVVCPGPQSGLWSQNRAGSVWRCGGRNGKSEMLTELIPGQPAVPSPGSLSPCLGDA